MGSISITADGNSASLSLTEAAFHKLSLRGVALDDDISCEIQYADIGQTNWRPLPVKAGEDPVALTKTYQDITVVGGTLVRLVVSNFGTSDTVTLANLPLTAVDSTAVQSAVAAALTAAKVLVEDQEYVFTNETSENTDNVTISRPA